MSFRVFTCFVFYFGGMVSCTRITVPEPEYYVPEAWMFRAPATSSRCLRLELDSKPTSMSRTSSAFSSLAGCER